MNDERDTRMPFWTKGRRTFGLKDKTQLGTILIQLTFNQSVQEF